jgi:hypothetical protein
LDHAKKGEGGRSQPLIEPLGVRRQRAAPMDLHALVREPDDDCLRSILMADGAYGFPAHRDDRRSRGSRSSQ